MASITKKKDRTGKPWEVRIRRKGKTLVEHFRTKKEADAFAAKVEADFDRWSKLLGGELRKHTLADLIDRYLRDVIPLKGRQGKMQTAQLQYWRSEIGAYSLADVTPAMIGEVRDKLLRTQTNRGGLMNGATVNRYLAALGHAFTVAVREWGWIDDNPVRKVTKLKEARGRVRFLSDDERERLLTECRVSKQPYLLAAVVLALSTGMRAQEILGLTWDRVNIEQGRILLEHTKNGERRLVPLVGQARALLAAQQQSRIDASPWVFPGRKDKPVELRAAFQFALDRAGIADFKFHDLRHSAASYLAMNGASVAEIAEVLGHKTLQMVKRYAHLSEAHTTGVVERMNRAVFGGAAE